MTYASDPRSPSGPPWTPPEFVPPGTPRPPGPGPYPPVPTVYVPATSADDELRARVYDQLLTRRTVVLDRPLDGGFATFVAAQLMTLDTQGPDPVTLVVNSPGGPLDAVSAVLDTIDLLGAPVDTTCLGQAGGTAAIVVASGTGRRRAGAGAQLRLRLPDVELSGTAASLRSEVASLNRLRESLVARLATITGQEPRLVARDVERGRVLSASEAVDYGLVDELVARKLA
jgi:ATP-dependent Clp protease, protease subunit